MPGATDGALEPVGHRWRRCPRAVATGGAGAAGAFHSAGEPVPHGVGQCRPVWRSVPYDGATM